MSTTLLEPAELAAHLEDPDWAIVDCRSELTDPEWGPRVYAQGHIPRALYAHLDRDLSGRRTARTGRHPLPRPGALAATFARLGIDARVQVVGYDQGSGVYAARLWWLLRWLGHRQVAVLNGGLAGWQRAGLPLSTARERRAPRQFVATADASMLVGGVEVATGVDSGAFERGEALLVDARSAERFAGVNETLDAVAGHVPGARNHPFAANHDVHGRFLPAAELHRAWQTTLAGMDPRRVMAMCGSGVTACDNLLALEIAGFSGARLYAGSWSEWITDPAHAIARGPATSR